MLLILVNKEDEIFKIPSSALKFFESNQERHHKEYLENDITANLPQIHPVTGFDTTFFLHVVGKIKVPKKFLIGKEKLRLLNRTGGSYEVSETGCSCTSKWKQKLLSLYQQIKNRCCKQLSDSLRSFLLVKSRWSHHKWYFVAKSWFDCWQSEWRSLSVMIHWYIFSFVFAFVPEINFIS